MLIHAVICLRHVLQSLRVKEKAVSVLKHRTMKTCVEMEAMLHIFSLSALRWKWGISTTLLPLYSREKSPLYLSGRWPTDVVGWICLRTLRSVSASCNVPSYVGFIWLRIRSSSGSYYDHCSERSELLKDAEFLNQLSDCKFPSNDPA
jgi:hypothetical protein